MKKFSTCKILLILIAMCKVAIAVGQPVADFSANTRSGCSPLTVQFSDNSQGNPTSWNWDFGNGTVSSQKNPVVTYFTAGNFTVKLTVSNGTGNNSITRAQYITVYDKPVVKFTVSDSANCVPFVTNFTDLSTSSFGTINAWEWDFDDGSTSTQQHPSHLYTQGANYNITLKVTNNGGCSGSLSKLAYVKAADSIRTLFSFTNPVQCKPPEVIRFVNNTAGPGPFTYVWNFGDGTTSTVGTPVHTYNNGGVYSVTLMVRNNLGCTDTLVYKDTLRIKSVVSSLNSPDTVCANSSMFLENTTAPVPLSSRWLFSDSTYSFGATTTKTWTVPGVHYVQLISNFSTCSDSAVKKIMVIGAPVIDFFGSDSAACRAPLPVDFTDRSTGARNWNWDFGDGSPNSSLQNPSHLFTNAGNYNVTLTVNNAAGCNGSLTKQGYVRIFSPVINFNDPEGGGCIPYTYKPVPLISSPDGIASYRWDFGNGNISTLRFPSQLYPDTGTFAVKLTVSSVDGCVDSAVINDAVKTGTLPVVDFSVSATVICPGTDILFTDLSLPSDKWLWNFADGATDDIKDPVHKFSDSGHYSIKLTAWNNGCKDSLSKYRIITVLPGMARFRPVYNCVNKKEVYFKDSSVLPQSWFWNFADGTTSTLPNPTHQFANYQTYYVSLTTTHDSCTDIKRMAVTPIHEVPDFRAARDSFCKTDSTQFFLQNFNKANIVKYTWDFGDGTIDSTSSDSVSHTYMIAGRYTIQLTATDIYGCSETTTKPNFIHVFGPRAGFTINAGGGCLNKTLNFTDTSNSQADHNINTWFWDFGDGQSQLLTAPAPTSLPHTYTAVGYYFPSLKIIDSVGCADSIAYAAPITINNPEASFFSPNYFSCIKDTVLFRNPSIGKSLTYLWSFGDGSSSTDSLPVKAYMLNGDYTVKLVITDAYGCKDSIQKNNYVRVRDVTASFKASDSVGICTPFHVDFTNTSTNSLSQIWSFGDGGFSSTPNPSYYYESPGTFYVKLTAKRSNTCYSTDSIQIKVTAPTATLSYAPVNGCAPLDVSFHLSTRDSVSFIWDFNDGVSYDSNDSTVIHSYVLPGNFVPAVILKDTSGCLVPVIGKDTIKLFSSKVSFGAADTVLCFGDTAYFSDSSISGSAITGYRWEFGDGNFSTQKNPFHYYNSKGNYSVKLFISTIYGCRDSLVKNNYIKVVNQPQVSISGNRNSYCGPSVVTLQGALAVADTAAIQWNWDFNNGSFSSLQSPLPQQFNDTGTYTIQLIAVNSGGCADTGTSSLTILPVPKTFAGKDTAICFGTTAQLLATGADNYSWLPTAFLSCSNCDNPVSDLPGSSDYFVKGTNAYGCEKTDTIHIEVKKPFSLSALKLADSVCAGKSVQLNVNGAERYSWSPGTGLSGNTISNPVAKPATDITYTVVGSDSINCFKDSVDIFIKVNSNPSVSAGADVVLNSGRSVTLAPLYSNDIVNWLWQPPAGLSCTGCATPTAEPANTTTYTIKVTNGSGCTAADQILVQVKCDKSSVFLPTAFTPGNGINNLFYPINPPGTGIFKITAFKIYNRYGQPVFQSGNFFSNDKSKAWDGRFNGREVPAGVYVYTIEFTCSNNQMVAFSGNILLLR